jgi:hypothetical protein
MSARPRHRDESLGITIEQLDQSAVSPGQNDFPVQPDTSRAVSDAGLDQRRRTVLDSLG